MILKFHICVICLGWLWFSILQYRLMLKKTEGQSLLYRFSVICNKQNRALFETVLQSYKFNLLLRVLVSCIPFLYVLYSEARILEIWGIWSLEIWVFLFIQALMLLWRVAIYQIAFSVVERYL
jgi:hypothetical protein